MFYSISLVPLYNYWQMDIEFLPQINIFFLFFGGLYRVSGAGTHLCPLSIGLHHQHDTGVWLIQRVSVQQSLAGHTQLHFGDAGSWTAEAGCRGGGLLDVIHPGSEHNGLPTGRAVQRETSSCEAYEKHSGVPRGISGKTCSHGAGSYNLAQRGKDNPVEPRETKPSPRCKSCLSELPLHLLKESHLGA